MTKQRPKKSGFTLIEMVVSISVIMMVTVLFIANYRTANKRTDLAMIAQDLVADLHLAQNHTLGLVKYRNTTEGTVPAGGWGISLDAVNNRYTLFADLDEPASTAGSGYMEYDPTLEGDVNAGARVTQLPDSVQISELKTDSTFLNERVNVTFLPPDPRTNIYRVGAGATSTALEIKLQELQGNTTRTIRVNFLGLIEVID